MLKKIGIVMLFYTMLSTSYFQAIYPQSYPQLLWIAIKAFENKGFMIDKPTIA